jgi:hypothetical protein
MSEIGIMSEYFYNFTLDGDNRGYSYLRFDHKTLYSLTRFLIEKDETYTNVFSLRLDSGRVLACKHEDADWVDLREQPPDHYPACAYPLLLPRVTSTSTTYIQISCDDGSVIGETLLSWEGEEIVESRDGKEYRRFTMREGVPVTIDWGGAVSHLCADADEAVAGSGLDFHI